MPWFIRFLTSLSILTGLAPQALALPLAPSPAHESNLLIETKEGFTAQGYAPPANLQRAWKSVVMVKAEKNNGVALGTGTTFLISLMKSGETLKGLFLTNHHVVDSLCEVATCDRIRIAYDTALAREGLKFIKSKEAFEKPVRIIKLNKLLDLALLEVELSEAEASKLEKIPMRTQCKETRGESVSLIGYPTTFWRPNVTKGTIAQSNLVTKRLSTGLVVGVVHQVMTPFHTTRVLQTTADAISGNSGGPAVDKDGYFMGVLFGANSISPESEVAGDKYFGQEQMPPYFPHSFLVSCPEVFSFLGLK